MERPAPCDESIARSGSKSSFYVFKASDPFAEVPHTQLFTIQLSLNISSNNHTPPKPPFPNTFKMTCCGMSSRDTMQTTHLLI